MNPQTTPADPAVLVASPPAEPPLIDPHWADLGALVSQAEANRVAMSRLHAERAELCALALELVDQRVAQRQAAGMGRGEPIGDAIPLREVVAELAAALRVSEQTVQRWLGDGAALVRRYSDTLEALREGRIDERHAAAIIDGGALITDDGVRAEYEQRVLPVAETETAPKLREHAEIIAARLQPDVAEAFHKAACERRDVRAFPLEPALSRVQLDIPTAAAEAFMTRVTDMAHTLDDDEDDMRTLGQRRADIAMDLLLCAIPTGHGDPDALAAIRATVAVTIPVLTLAGVGNEPAVLVGHGPIDADTARCLARNAPGWDRVMSDPHTGEPLTVDRYRPNAQLRRFLPARDQHCRWPGCRRKARKTDADHTVAHKDGGPTSDDNLCLFCRRHHVLKHASAWRIRQLGGGSLEFISPTGRVYRNDAPPVVQFVARPDLWADIDPADAPAF